MIIRALFRIAQHFSMYITVRRSCLACSRQFILSFSNLGTAILGANISKETVVIDGIFVANDGSAISTRNSDETISRQAIVKGSACRHLVDNVDADTAGDREDT